MLNLGFIGFGARVSTLWKRVFGPTKLCTVKAIADPALDTLKEKWGEQLTDCTWYTDAEEMLKNEKLDGVFIGTRCDLHTKYALLVAKYNIPLFLEKPVAISEEEVALLETIPHMEEKTVVSFPLRLTQYVLAVKDIVDRGLIGEVAQVQAYNNVNYARVYYHDWYRDDSITGGLFLQKATHDLDYISLSKSASRLVLACRVARVSSALAFFSAMVASSRAAPVVSSTVINRMCLARSRSLSVMYCSTSAVVAGLWSASSAARAS